MKSHHSMASVRDRHMSRTPDALTGTIARSGGATASQTCTCREHLPSQICLCLPGAEHVPGRQLCRPLQASGGHFSGAAAGLAALWHRDRKSTRLNSSHSQISYAVFCLKKKKVTAITASSCSREYRKV